MFFIFFNHNSIYYFLISVIKIYKIKNMIDYKIKKWFGIEQITDKKKLENIKYLLDEIEIKEIEKYLIERKTNII